MLSSGRQCRVVVCGISGAGKSTLSRRIACATGIEHVELDGYFHGPGWTRRSQFTDEVTAILNGPSWVVDSFGYPSVRELLWQRATVVIWLDLPRHEFWPRVLRRSFQRAWRREKLWHGNVETWAAFLTKEHPLWWSLSRYAYRRREISGAVAAKQPPFDLHHLQSTAEVRDWVEHNLPTAQECTARPRRRLRR